MIPGGRLWAMLLFSTLLVETASAAVRHRLKRVPSLSQRRRMHLQNLVTDPGTVEIEFGVAGSPNGLTAPFTIKYTPGVSHPFWHRTELSVDMDSVSSLPGDLHWVTQFSDHVGVAVTHLLHQGNRLSLYVAPQVAFLTRGNEGIRCGATGIANLDLGPYSLAGNMTWTGATSPSEANPAGDLQFGGGLVRRFGGTKENPHWTLFINGLRENPTIGPSTSSLFEGASYQVRRSWAIDFSVRHVNLSGGPTDHQVLGGVTVNLGRPRDW
ncbi:MAG: hypothetical protein HY235_30455 [Acidobacteria bacterium]|nr:hypothetical protein [Acidobacteriota bacterium]